MLRRLARLFRNVFRQNQVEADLAAEVESYLELVAAEKIAAGMSPEGARRAAHLELGSRDDVKERVRAVRMGAMAEQVGRDIRYGLRSLRRTPAFTTFTVLTFALAIGGITVIFGLVDAALLKPLPYPDSDRLVMVLEADARGPGDGYSVAAPNFLDWQSRNRVFERMALYEYLGFNLSGESEPEAVAGIRVTNEVFRILGVRPLLGRDFTPADDAGTNGRVVMLSYGLWRRRFGSDAAIVGKAIRINTLPYTVVGVMPQAFAFPSTGHALWVPIGLNEEDRGRGSHSFWSIARLNPGVSLERARAELRAIGDQLAKEYPAANNGETANVLPMRDLWLGDIQRLLQALFIAVVLVMLIASANIASLLVARGSARRREMAARIALGGTRARLVSQVVTESVLLALAGAILGFGLSAIGIRTVVAVFPPGLRNVPFRDLSTIGLSLPVFGFSVLTALLAGVVSGVAPALAVLPADPAEILRDSDGRGMTARRGRRMRNALVAGEVGLAVMVLVGAALLMTSMRRLHAVHPGFDPRNIVELYMQLPQADFYGPPERTEFCSDIDREVAQLPGVVAVSAVSHLPLSGGNANRSFVVEGEPDPGLDHLPIANYGVACPHYFRTMVIPVREGREFASADRVDAPPVVIINETLRARYFPHQDPVGRRLRLGRYDTPSPWFTIIAVVGDVRHTGLQDDNLPYLYRPYSQSVWPGMTIVARASTDPLSLAAPIRKALARVEAEAPVGAPRTMEQVVEESLGHLRFPVLLFTAFAAMAVVLAAVGIFGVASQSVIQRTRELGIRRALGARESTLTVMVIAQAMTPVFWGLAAGVVAGLSGAKVMRGLVYGIEPTNLPTFGLASVALAIVALVACFVPARKAAHVDPIIALRED